MRTARQAQRDCPKLMSREMKIPPSTATTTKTPTPTEKANHGNRHGNG